jgi:hypothetical protein
MNTMKLRDRVALLEAEVARLKEIVINSKPEIPWWKKITGAFRGDPGFEEAALGPRISRIASSQVKKSQKSKR